MAIYTLVCFGSLEERIASVEGCKFVDVVEPHCPYIMNEEYLKRMIKKVSSWYRGSLLNGWM